MNINIREATDKDIDEIWSIFHEVVREGDTYVFAPETSKEEMIQIWFGDKINTYVADNDKEILGTFIIKANQPGLGSHVANASFMVASEGRGKGLGKLMGEFAIEEAKRLGFHSMQFNIVISTNIGAIKLWEKLGFKIIGTASESFRHSKLGLVNSHIMYKIL